MSVSTCFLFIKYLTDEGCLSLSLNAQGTLDAPLAQRSFAELQQLQTISTKIIVVAPAEYFSFHRVELAWLPEKKARAAIPYALEEKLAENVEELHFSFDKHHYYQDHYLVVVCKKSYLTQIISLLDDHNIQFNSFTLDWFALDNNEACLINNNLLVHDDLAFNGLLNLELANVYFKQLPSDLTVYIFDENPVITIPQSLLIHDEPLVWIAKRLHTRHLLNICQGPLSHNPTTSKVKKWYYAAATMTLLWLISLLTLTSLKIHALNTKLTEVDGQIATIYRQFFPQAQQVISPRFRISQLLKGQSNPDNNFWVLLNELTETLSNNNSTIEQLRFQNQIMQITVISNDFNSLEGLQTSLQQRRINVRQTQASSKDGQVVGVLELSL
ncbi:type II secretion system protein GspL [Legionella busanensis]|uniref:type II secretion system protein GspL n=1 Tax=Legionella busanensis TaxID=190655 RepID=UPI000E1C3373|nr:type II secretion system protein GspL [Legionella busanensis]